MGAALSDLDSPDLRTTAVTALPCPLVNLKLVLEIAPPVYPIDTGAMAVDPILEGGPDRGPEPVARRAAHLTRQR